jgi:hypothetical protein
MRCGRWAGAMLALSCLVAIFTNSKCAFGMHAYVSTEHVTEFSGAILAEDVGVGNDSVDIDRSAAICEALSLSRPEDLAGREGIMDWDRWWKNCCRHVGAVRVLKWGIGSCLSG